MILGDCDFNRLGFCIFPIKYSTMMCWRQFVSVYIMNFAYWYVRISEITKVWLNSKQIRLRELHTFQVLKIEELQWNKLNKFVLACCPSCWASKALSSKNGTNETNQIELVELVDIVDLPELSELTDFHDLLFKRLEPSGPFELIKICN